MRPTLLGRYCVPRGRAYGLTLEELTVTNRPAKRPKASARQVRTGEGRLEPHHGRLALGSHPAWQAAGDRGLPICRYMSAGLVRQSQVVGFDAIDDHGAIFSKVATAVVARSSDRDAGGRSKLPAGRNMDRGSRIKGVLLVESVAMVRVGTSIDDVDSVQSEIKKTLGAHDVPSVLRLEARP